MSTSKCLVVESGAIGRGAMTFLENVNISIAPGEFVLIHGGNGIGKTTLIETIAGLVPLGNGSIRFLGRKIDKTMPHQRAQAGLRIVRDRNMLFLGLTVAEHFMMNCEQPQIDPRTAPISSAILQRTWTSKAMSLSGGEQRVVAILHALSTRPRVLLIDEFTEGLQYGVVREIIKMIETACDTDGASVAVVSQSDRLPGNANLRKVNLANFEAL